MSKMRLYVNGISWKSLDVAESVITKGYYECSVSEKIPPLARSIEEENDDDPIMMKKITFRYEPICGMSNLVIVDDELYFEEGCLYLKETKEAKV